MYRNLMAELARKGIKHKHVAERLGINEKTLRNKISGIAKFAINEGLLINKEFLPDCDFYYLFTIDETQDTA